MNTILKALITAAAVMGLAYILDGVQVADFKAAIIVAVVLALLRIFVRPLIIFFTLPLTIITLGLFLLVINAGMIMLADRLLDGFAVNSFWWALLFSLLLSFIQSATFKFLKGKKKPKLN